MRSPRSPATKSPRTAANNLARVIATWFGCGYAPVAPGTAGSLAALVIAIALHERTGLPAWQFAVLAGVIFAPAVWAATQTARAVNIKDPGIVVVDEVIGQWIAIAGAHSVNWKSYLGAFALFRLFDIWKPPPARQFERFPGGWGIVADDVMAGLYGALAIFLLDRFHIF